MSQVDVEVNGRHYRVTCDDGQEDRLHQLAGELDERVQNLADELGQIGDLRLILLSALTVCDDLFELRARVRALEGANTELDDGTIGGAARVLDAASARISSLVQRLDA